MSGNALVITPLNSNLALFPNHCLCLLPHEKSEVYKTSDFPLSLPTKLICGRPNRSLCLRLSDFRQCIFEIGQDVFHGFDADRKSQQVARDADVYAFLGGQTAMR